MYFRYAVYFVPDGAWGDFGASWLGWDSRSGTAVPLAGLESPDQSRLTQRPRKYGFHATIKAPFRLADEASPQDLEADLKALCAGLQAFSLSSLRLARIGRFFALVAPGERAPISRVADGCVEKLEPYRAPLSEAETARRKAGRLSARQEDLLAQWGYPYVFDEFRFHLTLTGPVEDGATMQPELEQAFAGISAQPLVFDSLSLMGEAPDGHFHQVARLRFSG